MKKILLPLLLAFGLPLFSQDISGLFEEGYTLTELDEAWKNRGWNSYKKWLKEKGYTYKADKGSYYIYEKNSVVELVLFYENKEITEIAFHSSPQKFYAGLELIEKDKNYRKVEEKRGTNGTAEFMLSASWVKNGMVYYANSDAYTIGIHPSNNNETARPTIPERPDLDLLSKTAITELEKRIDQEYTKKGYATKAPTRAELVSYLNTKIKETLKQYPYPAYAMDIRDTWFGEQNGKLHIYRHCGIENSQPDLQYQEFFFDPADILNVNVMEGTAGATIKRIVVQFRDKNCRYKFTRSSMKTPGEFSSSTSTISEFDFYYNAKLSKPHPIAFALTLLKRMAKGE